MGIGVSMFFLTIGAILTFAIEPDVLGSAVKINVIGIIFMVVGGVGLLLSIVFMNRRGRTSEDSLLDHERNPPTI
ncbi:hypothetical protein GCM10009677_39860 [Sphaerisporangium rubeum]|uniref:DUF6458 domain-containing protein n=1 Tax=Sphaerisporangium rubeum TaxID=321317 RepID=A0A7X0IK37_9ACTN|nr:DUF6458 family protein [Sphaerisporangium rubeum]MBB6476677.1 hypothetical protein [Sphaerisporangium rubeum]